MEGEPMIELTNPTRAEISCPMDFKFYPFDTQFCNFVIEPLMFDVRLLPYYVNSKQLDEQNIEMSYDIDIQPLLPKYLVRPSDKVRGSTFFLSYFSSRTLRRIWSSFTLIELTSTHTPLASLTDLQGNTANLSSSITFQGETAKERLST